MIRQMVRDDLFRVGEFRETVTCHVVCQLGGTIGRLNHSNKSSPGPRFRRSGAVLELVGDTGIEPVTSSVSGIICCAPAPSLSTKSVRRRPPMSTPIRPCCQSISQAAQGPLICGRPRTYPTAAPAYLARMSALPPGALEDSAGGIGLTLIQRVSGIGVRDHREPGP